MAWANAFPFPQRAHHLGEHTRFCVVVLHAPALPRSQAQHKAPTQESCPLLAAADDVFAEMSPVTGPPIRAPLNKRVMHRWDVRNYLTKTVHAELTPDELHIREATLEAFGPDFNLIAVGVVCHCQPRNRGCVQWLHVLAWAQSQIRRVGPPLLYLDPTQPNIGGNFFSADPREVGTMIKMTEKAARQFKEVLKDKSFPESTMLRVDAERVPGQKQVRLALRLDTQEPGPDDQVQTTEGARLAVDKALAEVLGDSQLDYQEESGGFVLARPEVPM